MVVVVGYSRLVFDHFHCMSDSASPPPMVDKGKQRATDGDAAMQVDPPNQHDNPAALAQPLLHGQHTKLSATRGCPC